MSHFTTHQSALFVSHELHDRNPRVRHSTFSGTAPEVKAGELLHRVHGDTGDQAPWSFQFYATPEEYEEIRSKFAKMDRDTATKQLKESGAKALIEARADQIMVEYGGGSHIFDFEDGAYPFDWLARHSIEPERIAQAEREGKIIHYDPQTKLCVGTRSGTHYDIGKALGADDSIVGTISSDQGRIWLRPQFGAIAFWARESAVPRARVQELVRFIQDSGLNESSGPVDRFYLQFLDDPDDVPITRRVGVWLSEREPSVSTPKRQQASAKAELDRQLHRLGAKEFGLDTVAAGSEVAARRLAKAKELSVAAWRAKRQEEALKEVFSTPLRVGLIWNLLDQNGIQDFYKRPLPFPDQDAGEESYHVRCGVTAGGQLDWCIDIRATPENFDKFKQAVRAHERAAAKRSVSEAEDDDRGEICTPISAEEVEDAIKTVFGHTRRRSQQRACGRTYAIYCAKDDTLEDEGWRGAWWQYLCVRHVYATPDEMAEVRKQLEKRERILAAKTVTESAVKPGVVYVPMMWDHISDHVKAAEKAGKINVVDLVFDHRIYWPVDDNADLKKVRGRHRAYILVAGEDDGQWHWNLSFTATPENAEQLLQSLQRLARYDAFRNMSEAKKLVEGYFVVPIETSLPIQDADKLAAKYIVRSTDAATHYIDADGFITLLKLTGDEEVELRSKLGAAERSLTRRGMTEARELVERAVDEAEGQRCSVEFLENGKVFTYPALISRNTREGELPWRLTLFYPHDGQPIDHVALPQPSLELATKALKDSPWGEGGDFRIVCAPVKA